MDGMILVAFFFPVIVVANFGLVIFGFLLTLYINFGDVFATYLEENYSLYIPLLKTTHTPTFNDRHPLFLPVLLNLLTIVSVVTTYGLGSYFHGNDGWRYYQPLKGGIGFILVQIGTWSCLAVSVIFPWLTLGESEIGPDSTINGYSSVDNKYAHGGLCVMASLFSIVAQTFAFLTLIAFDKEAEARQQRITKLLHKLFSRKQKIDNLYTQKLNTLKTLQMQHKQQLLARSHGASTNSPKNNGSEDVTRTNKEQNFGNETEHNGTSTENGMVPSLEYRKLINSLQVLRKLSERTVAEMDTQELNWNKVLGSQAANSWYLFAIMQLLTMVYITVLLVLVDLDTHTNTNNTGFSVGIAGIKSSRRKLGVELVVVMLVVFVVLLTITLAVTNSVGGKWRHGGLYGLVMLGKGGAKFVVSQTVAWTCFSFSLIATSAKLYELAFSKDVSGTTGGNGAFPYVRVAGVLGLASEVVLILSITLFDRRQSRKGLYGYEVLTNLKPLVSITSTDKRVAKDSSTLTIQKENVAKQNLDASETEKARTIRQSRDKTKVGEGHLNALRRRNVRAKTKSPAPVRSTDKSGKLRSSKVEKVERLNKNGERKKKRNVAVEEEADGEGEVWEECEDEAGNVFYYNVTTGASVQEMPQGSISSDLSIE